MLSSLVALTTLAATTAKEPEAGKLIAVTVAAAALVRSLMWFLKTPLAGGFLKKVMPELVPLVPVVLAALLAALDLIILGGSPLEAVVVGLGALAGSGTAKGVVEARQVRAVKGTSISLDGRR
jgi:hypothetical protein